MCSSLSSVLSNDWNMLPLHGFSELVAFEILSQFLVYTLDNLLYCINFIKLTFKLVGDVGSIYMHVDMLVLAFKYVVVWHQMYTQ